MERNITDIFVSYLHGLNCTSLPDAAFEQARLCLLDFEGVAIAGNRILEEQGSAFLAFVRKQGGTVSIVGRQEKTTMQNAAFLNAMAAHITELDDGHRKGQIHLGASIISALLPVAEVEGLSLEDVLRGIVVGYEAAVRLAMAMNPAHKLRGYHTSGTCGAIGVAVAVASAMKASRDVLKDVVSAATASASGLLELQEDRSELKPYNLAHATVGGITAAYCGMAGFRGPEDAIGGRRGLLAVLSDDPHTRYLTEFDEPCCQIERIYRKPYAACRHAHSAIEAALVLREKAGLSPTDIQRIRIETYGMAIAGHDHKSVTGVQSANMSIPFSVALAVVRGSAGLDDYSEATVRDEEILRLADKVCIVEDHEISSWLPERRAARVTIFAQGQSFVQLVEYPKGEPENPMSYNEVLNKFIDCSLYAGLNVASIHRVVSSITENISGSISDLLSHLIPYL